MSIITDLIKEKASEVLGGNISIPENLKEPILGGISDSIFGSCFLDTSKDRIRNTT